MTDEWDEMTPEQIQDHLADMEIDRLKEEEGLRIWKWRELAKKSAPEKVVFT